MPFLCLLAVLTATLNAALQNAAPPNSPEQVSAASVLNSFIASFAKVEVDWKKEISFIDSPSEVPPGKQLGYSTVVGYYSFSPKVWEELTPIQQQAVLRDQRLRSYIISLRNPTGMPAPPATTSAQISPANPKNQNPSAKLNTDMVGKIAQNQPNEDADANGAIAVIRLTPEALSGNTPIKVNLIP